MYLSKIYSKKIFIYLLLLWANLIIEYMKTQREKHNCTDIISTCLNLKVGMSNVQMSFKLLINHRVLGKEILKKCLC